MKRIYGMLAATGAFALVLSAQDTVAPKKVQAELTTTLNAALTRMKIIGWEGGVMSNVKGAPYRADQVSESTQMLGDGTRIHNERRVTLYRDSAGRVRRETPEQVSIWDPNSGVGYTLDPKNMTASKMQISVSTASGAPGAIAYSIRTQTGSNSGSVSSGAIGIASGATASTTIASGAEDVHFFTSGVPEPAANFMAAPVMGRLEFKNDQARKVKRESLGMQVMEGVKAQGDRETNTIELGEIGNDRPIDIVSEHWYSPELQMDVLSRRNDPRTGEEITRLSSISRAEPDPSLFELSPGYQILEGKVLPDIRLRKPQQ